MNILFVDTETTGVPKNESKSFRDIDNWPSIRQIAWLVYSKDNKYICGHNYEIGNSGKAINTFGEGYLPKIISPIHKVLPLFIDDLSKCDVIIGHNIDFDVNVILCELYRLGLETSHLESIQRFCTMKNSVEACGFDTQKGDRYPKLQELYTKLFHRPFENAHDAYCDMKATSECYWELFRSGYLDIKAFPYLLDDKKLVQLAEDYFSEAKQILEDTYNHWFRTINELDELVAIQLNYPGARTFFIDEEIEQIRSISNQVIDLLLKASNLGHNVSKAKLGQVYYFRREYDKAAKWFIEAGIELLDSEASFECAKSCASTDRFKHLSQKYFDRWVRMCEKELDTIPDHMLCQYILAFIEGKYGQEKNLNKALEICEQALKYNRTIVRMYIVELLDKKDDRQELVKHFLLYIEEVKIDDRSYHRSIEEKIVMYLFDGNGIQQDYTLAKKFIDDIVLLSKKTDYEKPLPGCLNYYLGQYYEYGLADTPIDYSKAFTCYLAAHNIPEAERKIGIMLLNGIGCEQNKKNAYFWLKRAKEKGLDVSPYYEEASPWWWKIFH